MEHPGSFAEGNRVGESLDKLVSNMSEAKPTLMTAVPRRYEAIHARIVSGVERPWTFPQPAALGRVDQLPHAGRERHVGRVPAPMDGTARCPRDDRGDAVEGRRH